MTVSSLITLSPDQLQALAGASIASSHGGGSAMERDLALAVALVAAAAGAVLALLGG